MSEYLIHRSALTYLDQWYVTDRRYMDVVTLSSVAGTAGERMQKLAAKYMVARNFWSGGLTAAEARRCWERVVGSVTDAVARTDVPVEQIVGDLADDLGGIFPDSRGRTAPALLSAASKFLWFSGRVDVRIYDKRAVNALNMLRRGGTRLDGKRGWRVNGSYTHFARAWDEEYVMRAKAIHSAVIALADALQWSIVPDGDERSEALKIMKESWFRDRVFDKYLWTIGSGDENNIGSFT